MGVKVRERPKGSGIYWVFIDHQGKRKSKKIGKDKRLAKEAAKKNRGQAHLGTAGPPAKGCLNGAKVLRVC
jgi:integrase